MEATPDPTPAEIHEGCLRIQGGWSEATERTRGAWAYEREPVELLQVKAADVLDAEENTSA